MGCQKFVFYEFVPFTKQLTPSKSGGVKCWTARGWLNLCPAYIVGMQEECKPVGLPQLKPQSTQHDTDEQHQARKHCHDVVIRHFSLANKRKQTKGCQNKGWWFRNYGYFFPLFYLQCCWCYCTTFYTPKWCGRHPQRWRCIRFPVWDWAARGTFQPSILSGPWQTLPVVGSTVAIQLRQPKLPISHAMFFTKWAVWAV